VIDYAAVAPALVGAGGAIAVLIADLFLPLARRLLVLWIAAATAVAAIVVEIVLAGRTRATFCLPATTLPGNVHVGQSCSFVVDRFTVYVGVLLAAGTLAVVASAWLVYRRRKQS